MSDLWNALRILFEGDRVCACVRACVVYVCVCVCVRACVYVCAWLRVHHSTFSNCANVYVDAFFIKQ